MQMLSGRKLRGKTPTEDGKTDTETLFKKERGRKKKEK